MKGIHRRVLRELEASKGRWPQVARESGVSRRTIEKIASGQSADPRISSIQKLLNYFERINGETPPPP
jgi:transcriptional regulator with XRE-family HTH domain